MTKPQRAYAHRKWNPLQTQGLENLLQRDDAVSHVPRDRGAPDLLASWKKWRKLLAHATLWHRADDLVLQFTVCKQQHGGNAHDIETTSDIAIVVNVEFCDGNLLWILCGDLFENGRNLLARSAPLSPKVNKDWL